MSKPTRVGRHRKGGKGRAAKTVEGDAFLLQASVLVCSAASLGWTTLQIVLYGGSEPAMIVVPLMYNVIVYGVVAYERFHLRVRPFRLLVHAHLLAVAVLPALLEMESGGFSRSGGVLGWAAVSPFTAMVVLQDTRTQLRYAGLFVTVVGVVGLSGGYALTSDAFEVHFWGAAGPGTPSCSWGVLIRHVGSILYSVESVNHVMPNADMMADPTRLPRVIAFVMVSYWLFVGAWVALTDVAGFGKCPGGGAIVIDCLPAGPPRDVLKVAVCLQLLASPRKLGLRDQPDRLRREPVGRRRAGGREAGGRPRPGSLVSWWPQL